VLICEPSQADLAVRCLIRIGLDSIQGFAPPATLESLRVGSGLATMPEINVNEASGHLQRKDAVILDVRRAGEFAAGHVESATNIAHTRLMARLEEVSKDKPLIVQCQGGGRSAFATAFLRRRGYNATNVAGGFGAWEKAGLPVVR
jgi:hydroxyacylglutathione hydrolase